MKAILKFDLDDPEDIQKHLRAIKSTDAYLVIWDMYQEFRKVWKYEEDEVAVKWAEHWRDKLNELCNYHNINVDEELN